MIKLLVFDVDGTLYDLKQHRIPQSCIEGIARAKEKGILFAIATGRTHYGLGRALNDLHADFVLSVNGALAADRTGRVLFHHDLCRQDVEQINAFCRDQEAGLCWKFADHCYIYQHPEKIDWLAAQKASDIGTEPFIDCFTQDRHLTELPQSASVHAAPEAVEKAFGNSQTVSFLRYSEDGYDVVCKGINKGVGLRDLMTKLGLKREEVAAFGDNYNDLEMLEEAGTAIAMGNAIDEVKAIADYVTTATDEDGIWNGLKYLDCLD